MLRKVIHRFLVRSHFWRDTGFDELSELYVSSMLRSMALTIFALFIPIYLYQNSYSGAEIFAFFGFFFVFRIFSDLGSAYFCARFGPKHTMIASNVMQIVSSAMLLLVPSQQWHVALLALPWGIAQSLFFISYHVSFSKIKHTKHAGSELGHMQTFEKVGLLLGPLVGGLLGSFAGPKYIFLTATILFMVSLWPLFLTKEPVKVHQKIHFEGLPVGKIKRDLIANVFLGIENSICINAWAFFVAVFVLSGAVYAQLGTLSALGVVVAILSARFIGRVVDTNLARPVLRFSAYSNALLHLLRPFAPGVPGVLAVNTANEALTPGYRMPFMKGVYAAADDLPGYRIVYISSLEAIGDVGKATVWFMLAVLATVFALKTVLIISFVIAAIASVGITYERFKVYN